MGLLDDLVGYGAPALHGFLDRKSEIEKQNIDEMHLAQQRENNIYRLFINSGDPQIQRMAVEGMVESMQPKKRKPGFAGYTGQFEPSSVMPRLQQYLSTPQPVTVPETDQFGGPVTRTTLPSTADVTGMGLPNVRPQMQEALPERPGGAEMAPEQTVRPGAPPPTPTTAMPTMNAPVPQATPTSTITAPPVPYTLTHQEMRLPQAFPTPQEEQAIRAQQAGQQEVGRANAAYNWYLAHGASPDEAMQRASWQLMGGMGSIGSLLTPSFGGEVRLEQLPQDVQDALTKQYPGTTTSSVFRRIEHKLGPPTYEPVSRATTGTPENMESTIDQIVPPERTEFGDLNTRTKAAVRLAQSRGDVRGVQQAIQGALSERSRVETSHAIATQPADPQLVKYLADQVQQDFGNWKMVSAQPVYVRTAVGEEMARRGVTPNVIEGADRTMSLAAKNVLPQIEKVATLAGQLNKIGLMGPIGGRWREFMTGTWGEQAGRTPQEKATIGEFRSAAQLLESAVARAHGGVRAAGSAPLLERMESIMGANKMDYPTFLGAMKGVQGWMQQYAGMTPTTTGPVGPPRTTTAPPPPKTGAAPAPSGGTGIFMGSDGQFHTGSPDGPLYKPGG